MKGGAVDSISSLPDVILQHILSFIPTKFAIRTSLLSKRWRHLWLETPSLSFNRWSIPEAAWVNKTLCRYTAPKLMRFDLQTNNTNHAPHLHKWIKFAMSRNVENLSLEFWFALKYTIPDFFYINSSVKQLTVKLHLVPRCSVSWTSLKNLFLLSCSISDDSMAKILYGCPILESLRLYYCDEILFLDLRKSLRLRTLDVERNGWVPGPTQIVAPHIHCLRLINYQLPCTLVNVSSLTEANLNIGFSLSEPIFKADFLQVMVLNMLEKLQHVENLTFGENFLRILSLAVLCGAPGVPFPMIKVKALTLESHISQYVIPGLEKVLRNSPDLKKLTIHTRSLCDTIPGECLDDYLQFQGFNPVQCWKSIDEVGWNKSLRGCSDRNLSIEPHESLNLTITRALNKNKSKIREMHTDLVTSSVSSENLRLELYGTSNSSLEQENPIQNLRAHVFKL